MEMSRHCSALVTAFLLLGCERADPSGNGNARSAIRAAVDCIIGITACSAYASNGGTFKPIHYSVRQT